MIVQLPHCNLVTLATLQWGSCTIIWLVPVTVTTVLCTPDDGCERHPKHVEWSCSKIKYRLHIVASHWTFIIKNCDARNHEHKKKKHLRQFTWSFFANLAGLRAEDLNPSPPEYIAELLPTRPRHWVIQSFFVSRFITFKSYYDAIRVISMHLHSHM